MKLPDYDRLFAKGDSVCGGSSAILRYLGNKP